MMTELTPMNALKRILSEVDAPEHFSPKKVEKERESSSSDSSDSSESSKQSDLSKSSKSSKIEEETFKTSLYNQKKIFNDFSVDDKVQNKPRQTKKKIIKNL